VNKATEALRESHKNNAEAVSRLISVIATAVARKSNVLPLKQLRN
jgi:hypothetical protein